MRKIIAILAGLALSIVMVSAPALAGGQNYAKCWEDLVGARWNGYVQIQASYNDGGRHAKQGYHRFTRKAGPSLDTGRMHTSQASSRYDSQVRSRTDSVWDSPLWGDQYTTKYHYGFYYW